MSFVFDRHKIFLYKEDFRKFGCGFREVVDFIKRSQPDFFDQQERCEEKTGVEIF